MERGIPHLVMFLPKLSKIVADKNFLKRGEVDVIKIHAFDKNSPHFNGTMTGLSLNHHKFTWNCTKYMLTFTTIVLHCNKT